VRVQVEMASGQRQYTDEVRADVIRDVKELGVSGAARKHGVPKTTVSRWAAKAAVTREASGRPDHHGGARDAGGKTPVTSARTARSATETEERLRKTRSKAREATTAESSKPSKSKSARSKLSAAPATGSREVPRLPLKVRERSKDSVGSSPKAKKRIAKVYTPTQKASILEYAAEHGVKGASEKFGASRFSIYDWQRKVAMAAKGEGESPTSGEAPRDIEERRDREILAEWHKHAGLGPSQIRNQLRRANVKVSVNTVRRVMEDAGYRPPKIKREPHDQRYEATRPNHLWHLDFLHRHINRQSTFTLILLDDCSRYVVGHGVDDAERADLVVKTFEEASERHGRPETVMHDKGSAFWSWRGISRFTELLTEMGIDIIPAEHKEWNGKIEVFNANLSKELFDVQRFYDVAEMKRRLAAHLHWYNHARTHHALGGLLVPADRYYGRVQEVLARIEAGAGRDLKDFIDLRERCLELFKVTSVGGVPEVWLLGQKLLGPASSR
jgi:putative transposase